MRVINDLQSNRGYQPNFQKAVFIDVSRVPKKKLPALLAEFKSIIGNGPVGKSYIHNGESFNQDIFVGYNQKIDEINQAHAYLKNGKIRNILIGTGNDSTLGGRLNSKVEQIDDVLTKKINEVLQKFDVLNNNKAKVLISETGEASGEVYHLITSKTNTVYTELPSNSLQDSLKVKPDAKYFHTAVSITPKFLDEINEMILNVTGKQYCSYKNSTTNAIYLYRPTSPGRKFKLTSPFFEFDWSILNSKTSK